MASFSSATSSALIETRDLAGLAVELGDAGVDLLTDGETLRALIGAVAGEIGALDEGGEIGTDDLHFEAAFLDVGDFAGDDRALLESRRAAPGVHRIAVELLDAERDALLLDIDVENLRLDHVALLVLFDHLLARTLPVEVGEMDHAVDIAVEAEEQAEFGLVLDFAFDGRCRADASRRRLPTDCAWSA